MVEPQPLQPVVRDQAFDQPVNGVERSGILDPQSGQRIDVEESPVVDLAGGEPPLPGLVVLTLQQMMQRQRLGRPVRSGAVGVQPARNNFLASCNAFQLSLECRSIIARRMTRALVA